MKSGPVDIIIPHYGVDETVHNLLLECLTSILTHTAPEDYNLVLVDNGSQGDDLLNSMVYLEDHANRQLIHFQKPVGFVRAVNAGLRLTTGELVVLLNNDTRVPKDWLPRLKAGLDLEAMVGMAGPRSSASGSWQGQPVADESPVVLPPGRMLAFFCVLMRRSMINQVGLLDESFGLGLGDDDDYCARAEQFGWKFAFCRDVLVHHGHRTTFSRMFTRQKIHEMQVTAMKRLQQKFPHHPHIKRVKV